MKKKIIIISIILLIIIGGTITYFLYSKKDLITNNTTNINNKEKKNLYTDTDYIFLTNNDNIIFQYNTNMERVWEHKLESSDYKNRIFIYKDYLYYVDGQKLYRKNINSDNIENLNINIDYDDYFLVDDNYIAYINNNMINIINKNNKAKEILDVNLNGDISLIDGKIYYVDNEGSLYKYNIKTKEQEIIEKNISLKEYNNDYIYFEDDYLYSECEDEYNTIDDDIDYDVFKQSCKIKDYNISEYHDKIEQTNHLTGIVLYNIHNNEKHIIYTYEDSSLWDKIIKLYNNDIYINDNNIIKSLSNNNTLLSIVNNKSIEEYYRINDNMIIIEAYVCNNPIDNCNNGNTEYILLNIDTKAQKNITDIIESSQYGFLEIHPTNETINYYYSY